MVKDKFLFLKKTSAVGSQAVLKEYSIQLQTKEALVESKLKLTWKRITRVIER